MQRDPLQLNPPLLPHVKTNQEQENSFCRNFFLIRRNNQNSSLYSAGNDFPALGSGCFEVLCVASNEMRSWALSGGYIHVRFSLGGIEDES